jgi:hypothetical protein
MMHVHAKCRWRGLLDHRLARVMTAAVVLLSATCALAQSPLRAAKTAMVPFDNSPFPYRGEVPGKNVPFMDVVHGERRGHTSPRGGIYWEDITYNDRRALLSLPRGFDAHRPALIVVYFHGNGARLIRDVRDRQGLPRQLAQSGVNAALVAPQFAVDALFSSSGAFWQPGVFARFLDEAGGKLARLHSDPSARDVFARAPVVIVAYSGGYNPAAFALALGGANARVRGVILLDALFAEEEKFADWLASKPPAFFVSAYGRAARNENGALQKLLTERHVVFHAGLPRRLDPGGVNFLDVGNAPAHDDFVTRAWVEDPVKVLLARIPGFSRTPRPR